MDSEKIGLQKMMTLGIVISVIPLMLALLGALYVAKVTISTGNKTVDFSVLISEYYNTTRELNREANNFYLKQDEAIPQKYEAMVADLTERLNQFDTENNKLVDTQIRKLETMLSYLNEPFFQSVEGSENKITDWERYSWRYSVVTLSKALSYDVVAQYTMEQIANLRKIQKSINVLLIILLFISAVAIVLSYKIIKKVLVTPIIQLEKNVQSFGDDGYMSSSIRCRIKEINSLNQAFNEMAEKINCTMNAISENAKLEEENLIAQNKITMLKLRNLQSQINPHFLFNTLSMISNTALNHADSETYEMIRRLTNFLRYALDNVVTTSTIGQEIDAIENYLYIQKKRFGSRIAFSIDCDSQFYAVAIPAITIQPLIENAITHGMPANRLLSIRVQIEKENDDLVISVEDDGVGMDAETVEALYETLMKASLVSLPPAKHIGLSNVYSRYRMMFGENMAFCIESMEDCGTSITMKIPYLN